MRRGDVGAAYSNTHLYAPRQPFREGVAPLQEGVQVEGPVHRHAQPCRRLHPVGEERAAEGLSQRTSIDDCGGGERGVAHQPAERPAHLCAIPQAVPFRDSK